MIEDMESPKVEINEVEYENMNGRHYILVLALLGAQKNTAKTKNNG